MMMGRPFDDEAPEAGFSGVLLCALLLLHRSLYSILYPSFLFLYVQASDQVADTGRRCSIRCAAARPASCAAVLRLLPAVEEKARGPIRWQPPPSRQWEFGMLKAGSAMPSSAGGLHQRAAGRAVHRTRSRPATCAMYGPVMRSNGLAGCEGACCCWQQGTAYHAHTTAGVFDSRRARS